MEEQKLFTTQETAILLGVSDSYLRNMIRTGKAQPKQRMGNSWIFTPQEIERLRERDRKTGPKKK